MSSMSGLPICVLLLTLAALAPSYADLSNLGEEISNSVRQGLAPLEGLGQRISDSVQQGLAPLQGLGQRISDSVQQGLAPLQGLGQRISNSVHSQLQAAGVEGRGPRGPSPGHFHVPDFGGRFGGGAGAGVHMPDLSHLGADIQQSVYEGLAPVRALAIVQAMKDGVGGATVKTFKPAGKSFIRKNGQTFTCGGTISSDDGHCRGNLTPFRIKDPEDQCYAEHRAFISTNGVYYICLAEDGFTVVRVDNDKITCEGRNAPAVLLTKDEYLKQCGSTATSVEYKYYADNSDPHHVQIPNKNKYVKCENNQPGVCVFTEDQATSFGGSTTIVSGGNFQSSHATSHFSIGEGTDELTIIADGGPANTMEDIIINKITSCEHRTEL